MTGQVVRVGVYSPQPIVREGLVSLLERHPDKVRVAPTPTAPGDPEPDVVLYDVMALLGGDTGPLTYLVEQSGTKVLAVSRDLRPDLVGRALATGADGFLSMGADEDELLAAVQSAVDGCADSDEGSNASPAYFQANGVGIALSPRETEVLALIAAGLSNQQIAAEMFLSINSVKTYIRSAYRKIAVERRSAAVAWAIRHGLAPTR